VSEPPSWVLRIEGGLVDDGIGRLSGSTSSTNTANPSSNPSSNNPNSSVNPSPKKFSNYFKKVLILLDDDLPENTIEWDKFRANIATDGFEIRRSGYRETEARIYLYLDYCPPRYKLQPGLAQALNLHTETRPRVLMALWQYIKAHRLQDPEDRRYFILNNELKQIFNCERMAFASIPELFYEHLGPPDPILLTYRIRLSGDPAQLEETYNIQISEDEESGAPILPKQKEKDITALNQLIAENIAAVQEHITKREFMHQFSQDPVNFLNNLIASQARDYKLLNSEDSRDSEEERQTSFYYQPYTNEAVSRYLYNHITTANKMP